MRSSGVCSDILATAFSSICSLKLTKADQLQPPPSHALVHPLLLDIKGKVLLVTSPLMCTRAFHNFNDAKKYMLRAEYITDSEGFTGFFVF